MGKENYNHIYQEIEKDYDYTRVQKILSTSKRLDYNTEKLLKDMREVFFSDNGFDEVEKGVFLLLKKLLYY